LQCPNKGLASSGWYSGNIERLDEHIHTHDIEESFRIKNPSILRDYIKTEAAKNYSAAQIYHAVRGAGTHEGSERLGELGGSLKRKVSYYSGCTRNRICGAIVSSTGNTYFRADTSSTLILKSKC